MKSILLPIFSILLCGSKTSFGWTQTSPKLFHLGNQNGQFRQGRQFLQPTSNIPGLTSGLPGKQCSNILEQKRGIFVFCDSPIYLFTQLYREFSHYANFISANFITVIFQNFPKIFGLSFFMPAWLMQFWSYFCLLCNFICYSFCYFNHQVRIWLM